MFVKCIVTSVEKKLIISDLKLKFHSKFLVFKPNEKLFNLFSIPISLSVEDVLENNMQLKIIDLQNNTIFKGKV